MVLGQFSVDLLDLRLKHTVLGVLSSSGRKFWRKKFSREQIFASWRLIAKIGNISASRKFPAIRYVHRAYNSKICHLHLSIRPFFERVVRKKILTLLALGYNVAKACASPRNSTWFTRPFLLVRGWWGLGTRLENRSLSRDPLTLAMRILFCFCQCKVRSRDSTLFDRPCVLNI